MERPALLAFGCPMADALRRFVDGQSHGPSGSLRGACIFPGDKSDFNGEEMRPGAVAIPPITGGICGCGRRQNGASFAEQLIIRHPFLRAHQIKERAGSRPP